jgi:O-antigen/teichoic acid export membrane protein
MGGGGGMIAQTIQLALAPVFVLVAIGNIINTLSSRLGRVVDRSRVLQQRHGETEGAAHDAVVREIRITDKRIHLIGRALLLLVLAGLCIGFTVVLLFVEEFAAIDVQPVAAGSFILAIGFLMNALVLFLRETRQATEALRIPAELLEWDRKL